MSCDGKAEAHGEPLVDQPRVRAILAPQSRPFVQLSNYSQPDASRTTFTCPFTNCWSTFCAGFASSKLACHPCWATCSHEPWQESGASSSITRLELSCDLAERLSGTVADLVVAERVSGASNAVTADLLTIRPDICLLELSANGRMAWFSRTGRPMAVLVDFSAQELIDMLDFGGVGSFEDGATRGNGA